MKHYIIQGVLYFQKSLLDQLPHIGEGPVQDHCRREGIKEKEKAQRHQVQLEPLFAKILLFDDFILMSNRP